MYWIMSRNKQEGKRQAAHTHRVECSVKEKAVKVRILSRGMGQVEMCFLKIGKFKVWQKQVLGKYTAINTYSGAGGINYYNT